MHFFYQRSVHDDYDGEEGTPGRRAGAMDKNLGDLTTKKIDLIWLEAEKERRTKPKPQWRVLKPGETGAHGYVRVTGDQPGSGPSYAGLSAGELDNRIAETRKQIKDIETKLQREGVVWISSQENGLPKLVFKQDQAKVVYDHDPQLQELTRVTIRGGKLYIPRPLGPGMLAAPFKASPGCGQTQEALLDTGQSVTEFSGAGVAIYVMSGNGNLHVSGHSPGWRHHSSLLGGQPVAGAGEIKISRGRIIWISNKSGHYKPKDIHFVQVLALLAKRGVPMDFAVHYSNSQQPVLAFLERMRNEAKDFEYYKLLAYSAHLKEEVLGRNGWRWCIPGCETPGVYSIATGEPIPHRDVRKWLKSQNLRAQTEISDPS